MANMPTKVKLTKLTDGTKEALVLNKINYDSETKKLTLYNSEDNNFKEETTISVETDTTFSERGVPADAWATGSAIASVQAQIGSPLVADQASKMTDTSKIYVYTGTESGYTKGNWYYYDGTAWVSGGVYNSVAVEVDKTLRVDGMPADANATGDAVNELSGRFGGCQIINSISEMNTVTADKVLVLHNDSNYGDGNACWFEYLDYATEGGYARKDGGKMYPMLDQGALLTADPPVEKMMGLMASYLENDALVYGNDHTMFDSETTNEIDCSSFVSAILHGISYNSSKYTTGSSTRRVAKVASYSPLAGRLFGHLKSRYMAQFFAERKWLHSMPTTYQMRNILQFGDILFSWDGTETAKNRYLEIGHVSIVLGIVNNTYVIVAQCGGYPSEVTIKNNSTTVGKISTIALSSDNISKYFRAFARVPYINEHDSTVTGNMTKPILIPNIFVDGNRSGELSSSNVCATSYGYIGVLPSSVITFTGETVHNGNNLTALVAEYDDKFKYLSKTNFTTDPKTLSASTRYIRLCYSHPAGSDIPMLLDDCNQFEATILDKATGSAIEDLNLRISEVESEISDYIDAKSVNGLLYENNILYLTSNNEIVGDGVEIKGGGGGGGGDESASVIEVANTTGWLSKTISYGQNVELTFTWSSIEDEQPTGNGTLQITVNNIVKRTLNVAQGNLSVNVSEYLSSGNNSVRIRISDIYGKSRSIIFSIKAVELTVSSNFNASSAFSTDTNIDYTYTPYGAVEKTVYFKVDGTTVGTSVVTASGRQQTYTLPSLTHGSHTLLVYFEADVDGETVTSNELYYDLIVVDDSSNKPIISSTFRRTTASQYETIVIPYKVYTPNSLTSEVVLTANGEQVSTLTVDRTEQTWSYRHDEVGSLTLKITSGSTNKTFNLTITESEIDVEPETEGLSLYLTSYGHQNTDDNPDVWEDKDRGIVATMSGFNFVSNGWVTDNDGITVLRINNGASVTIPVKPFATDFTSVGKTIEIEFAARNVFDYNAVPINCINDGCGFQLTSQRATLKSQQKEITTQYKEDEHVRVSFVVEPKNENRLILIYINGIASGVVQYSEDDLFSQRNPVDIVLGADGVTLDIYNIRIYNSNLTRYQVLNNWIADTQNITERIRRYEHNDIYDEYGQVVIDKLPNDLPYFLLDAEELPQYKGHKLTISGSYIDPLYPSKSFTFAGCQINVQGTSSAPYPRKNYDMQFKNGFEIQGEHTDNYMLADGIIPFNRFVLKADVASSEGANNVELVKLYCDLNPFETREKKADPRVRSGIYGFPIVLFWHNTKTGETKFMGKYNFNLPKRAPAPYGYSGDMESWEFQNNTSNLMLFKTDFFDESIYTDPTTQESKERWRYDYEARFPSDEWVNYAKLQELQSFIYSTYRAGATGNTLDNPVTYPSTRTEIVEVVDPETGAISYEEKTYKIDVTYTTDTADYRLAKFKAEFGNYAEIDSFVFYYVFTELFLMVDSRAKNLFIGFSGSDTTGLNVIDRKAVAEPYDMDTAIGTNNEGALVFGYSYEDTDHLEGGAEIFNGQTSVLWCNIRDAFPAEVAAMYQRLRTSGLNYANVEQRFEDHQGKWCEAVFNEDSWFKYIYPLTNPDEGKEPTGSYLSMMQGSKEEQRKWWLYNRFRYMDSKWNAGDALTDVIQIRGYAKANITVTPYADIYPTVKYGSYIVAQRGTHGVPVTLVCPVDNLNDTEIYIYSAPQLSSVGDLSPLKVGFADFSKATSLQSIVVGSNASGYTNLNLKELNIGTNNYLKLVDARNCTALTGSINLSNTPNIEHVYFDGTSISAVNLPVGGILKTLSLPSTITNLTIRNQNAITTFNVENNDYSHISTLRIENSSSIIPLLDILSSIESGTRVRIIGFNMAVTSQTDEAKMAEVEAFYNYLDTMKGVDENGTETNKAVVSGTITGLGDITGTWLAQMYERYPNIKIEYEHITSYLKYYTYDGSSLLYTESVRDGGNGTYNGSPSRTSTAQYSFTFVGWSLDKDSQTADPNATKNVSADRNVYAAYSRTLRSYTVYWRNIDNTLLETDTNVPYGSMPQYNGAKPTYQGRTATGWTPNISAVVGNTTYTATYVPIYQVNFYNGDTLLQTVNVEEGSDAVYTGETPTSPTGDFLFWNPEPVNVHSNIDVYAVFDIPIIEPDLKYLVYTLNETDKTMTITGLNIENIIADNLAYITIPDTINGYHVILE